VSLNEGPLERVVGSARLVPRLSDRSVEESTGVGMVRAAGVWDTFPLVFVLFAPPLDHGMFLPFFVLVEPRLLLPFVEEGIFMAVSVGLYGVDDEAEVGEVMEEADAGFQLEEVAETGSCPSPPE